MYAVMMTDLKQSRAYLPEKRQGIQQTLLEITGALNDVFAPSLVRPVQFSGGDGMQGLFRGAAPAYLYQRLLALLAFGIPMRAGIGVGGWDVRLETAGTNAQDGTAYHRARTALDAAADCGAALLFYSESEIDLLVNALIGPAAAAVDALSRSQRDVTLLTELLAPLYVPGAYVPERLAAVFPLSPEQIRPVDITRPESGFFTTGGRLRGLPGKIAGCLDITRQSVEKVQKAADVYGMRNLAMAALGCMCHGQEG